jgi:hypothetical protein
MVWVVVACRLDVGVSVVLCIIYLPLILISVDLFSTTIIMTYYHTSPCVMSLIYYLCVGCTLNFVLTLIHSHFSLGENIHLLCGVMEQHVITSCACS